MAEPTTPPAAAAAAAAAATVPAAVIDDDGDDDDDDDDGWAADDLEVGTCTRRQQGTSQPFATRAFPLPCMTEICM